MSLSAEKIVNESKESLVAVTEQTGDVLSSISVTDTIAEILVQVDAQRRALGDISRQLKKLEKEIIKEHKRLSKVNRPKRKVVQKPVQVVGKMKTFMKKMATAQKAKAKVDVSLDASSLDENEKGGWTRQQMMRGVSTYIKDKTLQIATEKRNWKPDKTLTSLFALESDALYTFMNINGLISRVVKKPKT